MTTIKCSNCNHIHFKGEEHSCPSDSYMSARKELIKDASLAELYFTMYDLESFTEALKTCTLLQE